jgi:hypothetical protein
MLRSQTEKVPAFKLIHRLIWHRCDFECRIGNDDSSSEEFGRLLPISRFHSSPTQAQIFKGFHKSPPDLPIGLEKTDTQSHGPNCGLATNGPKQESTDDTNQILSKEC